MTFVQPLLLGGLLLAGLPVLFHLLMREKPKRLRFPAYRFLVERQHRNQQTLRLRHLLLLALRIVLIVLLALALARPRLSSEGLPLGQERPVAVVLLFDTSLSMEYTVAAQSRLDEARKRALELLDELPDGSKVAVFDSADAGGEWQPTLELARTRVAGLALQPGALPVTRQMEQAFRLLERLQNETTEEEPLPRLLYVFSDRTRAAWDPTTKIAVPESVRTVFLDVGVEEPLDVAIERIEFPTFTDRDGSRQAFDPEDRFTLRPTVRATGQPCNTELLCRVEGRSEVYRQQVVLAAGESRVFSFEIDCRGLLPGYHGVEFYLGSADSLPFDNTRSAAFLIRSGRRMLVVCDDPKDARFWTTALEVTQGVRCDVRPVSEIAGLSPEDLLSRYQALALVDVARPDASLWNKLRTCVQQGLGLAVVPGGEELLPDAYNDAVAQSLLPAKLEGLRTAAKEPGVPWISERTGHALMGPLFGWMKRENLETPELQPAAFRYWNVTPGAAETQVLVRYADGEGSPALLERGVGRGRVLLFTTPMDNRRDAMRRPWNTYWSDLSPFGFVLTNRVASYLAGDAEAVELNFLCGQMVAIDLPATPRFPLYTLQGPELRGADVTVTRPEGESRVELRTRFWPGNFALFDGKGAVVAGFSVAELPEECDLQRVPVEVVEQMVGKGNVVTMNQASSLRETLEGRWNQPLELLPYLLLLLLLALAAENLLANRFYRAPPGTPAQAEKAPIRGGVA